MAKGKTEVTVAVNVLKTLEIELDNAGVLHIAFLKSDDEPFCQKRVESFGLGDKVTLTVGQ